MGWAISQTNWPSSQSKLVLYPIKCKQWITGRSPHDVYLLMQAHYDNFREYDVTQSNGTIANIILITHRFVIFDSIKVNQMPTIHTLFFSKQSDRYQNIFLYHLLLCLEYHSVPDNKDHGANMGPIWVIAAPDGPHVGPMNLAIRDVIWRGTGTENENENITHYYIKSIFHFS